MSNHLNNRRSRCGTGRAVAGFRLCLIATVALASAAGAQTTVDFDSFSNGTLLTTQLSSSGVTFPNGVNVTSTSRARSAPNVVVPLFDGEFMRDRFEATFSDGQEAVSLYVRSEQDDSVARTAVLRAFSSSGFVLDTDSVAIPSTPSSSGWRFLQVSDGFGTIRRVELVVTESSESNFALIDDLRFTGGSEPPPPDTIPPTVRIDRPGTGVTRTAPNVEVEVTASDNVDLFSVEGDIIHLGTGTIVATMDYCGSVVSGACSNPYSGTRTVSLDRDLQGDHRVRVTGCDSAGNCSPAQRNFDLDLPAPPADVTVERVEINQGVQNRLFTISSFPTDRTGASTVRLIAKRDTVVRFYPLADGADRADYTARMSVRVTYDDDTVANMATGPNAGSSTVDVVADPLDGSAREDEYALMRTNMDRTLNFVIPAARLDNARMLEVRLEEGSNPVTGWLRVGLNPEVRLAVKDVRLFGPGIPGGGSVYPTEDQLQNVYRYLEEVYPVSEVVRTNAGSWVILQDPFCEFFAQIGTDSPRLACALWQFHHYSPPGDPAPTQDPTYIVSVGRFPFGNGRVGMAMGRTSLAMGFSDIAYAHEIGHTVGLRHAGGAHGEGGAEAWPHPHGTVGVANFGVVTSVDTEPGRFDLGQWEITLVDPCPVPMADRINDCAAQMDPIPTHDFMSYGDSSVHLGEVEPETNSSNWISDINWNRIYDRIRNEGQRSSSTFSISQMTGVGSPAAGGATVDALVIDGVGATGRGFRMLPILASVAPAERLETPPPGPYRMELLDRRGTTILARDFDVTRIEDAGVDAFVLGQVFPRVEGLNRVLVSHNGELIADVWASANAPTVRVLSPNGGEVLDAGVHTLTWEVADADGDPVISRVEYSADGGDSWVTLGMVGSDDPTRLDIDTRGLTASRSALFRVAVTDGFRTASDDSDCLFAVREDAPEACTPDPEPDDCVTSGSELCLGDRFVVEVDWSAGADRDRPASAVGLTDDTGYFWFFGADNVEVVVKVLNGCGVNGHFWVYAAGLTDVGTVLRVTDTETGEVKTYSKAEGAEFVPIFDVEAFASCSSGVVSLSEQTTIGLSQGGSEDMLLGDGRFRVRMAYRTASGDAGNGQAVQLTADTGYFWFFDDANVEAVVKVLDGCGLNQRHWVFAGGLTDVEATIYVEDTLTGEEIFYHNPLGTPFLPRRDTDAFAGCQ